VVALKRTPNHRKVVSGIFINDWTWWTELEDCRWFRRGRHVIVSRWWTWRSWRFWS